MAHQLLDLGFMISFSGIVTFRNADPLREVARGIPVDRLLIETDTPYLTPVPHRGKPNEPCYLPAVAELLARIRGVEVEELARQTTVNAAKLFGSMVRCHLHAGAADSLHPKSSGLLPQTASTENASFG
jgi:TatD DNase family protein